MKSWSEREVVRAWNSGSSAYWGSSERRHVVGWAIGVLVGTLSVLRAVGCMYIRGLGYLGRTWRRRSRSRRPGWARCECVVWESASLLLATLFGAIRGDDVVVCSVNVVCIMQVEVIGA